MHKSTIHQRRQGDGNFCEPNLPPSVSLEGSFYPTLQTCHITVVVVHGNVLYFGRVTIVDNVRAVPKEIIEPRRFAVVIPSVPAATLATRGDSRSHKLKCGIKLLGHVLH